MAGEVGNLGSIDLTAGDYASAYDTYVLALETCRDLNDEFAAPLAHLRPGLGQALLGLGRHDEARELFAGELSRTVRDDLTVDSALKPHLGVLLSGVALASRPETRAQAARLRGAVIKLSGEGEFLHHEQFWNTLDQVLIDALGRETWQEEQAAGAAMTLDRQSRSHVRSPPPNCLQGDIAARSLAQIVCRQRCHSDHEAGTRSARACARASRHQMSS